MSFLKIRKILEAQYVRFILQFKNDVRFIQKGVGGILNLEDDRHIFTKKAMMLRTGYFLIEVSKSETTFYIADIK